MMNGASFAFAADDAHLFVPDHTGRKNNLHLAPVKGIINKLNHGKRKK